MKTTRPCNRCITPQSQPATHSPCSCCPGTMSRRRFVAGAGASAAALQLGVLDFAASVMASPAPTSKPLIRVAFVRPEDPKGYWMTFTGPGYDVAGRTAEFTRIMGEAARQLDKPAGAPGCGIRPSASPGANC